MGQLKIPFDTLSPHTDETPCPGEEISALVKRLAREKAQVIAKNHPDSIIIGSDQLAVCNGLRVGKPGSREKARIQLESFSGQAVIFLTAVAVLRLSSSFLHEETVSTEVKFRSLEAEEIARYIEADQPMDCAGSFKSESLGISLLESMASSDPTAIVGLPLITVSKALRKAGINLP